MKTVHNSLNYNSANYKGEVNNLPSLTLPDQTMSMREIYSRFVRGMPITGGKVPLYEDPEVPTNGRPIQSYDLTELAEMAEEAKEVLNANKKRQADRQKQEQDKKFQTDLENAVNQRLKNSKQDVAGASEA